MHARLRRLTAAGVLSAALVAQLSVCNRRVSARESPKPLSVAGPALEKTVLGEDVPAVRSEFSVSADGKRAYFGFGLAYYVFDEDGDLLERLPTKGSARKLALLSN